MSPSTTLMINQSQIKLLSKNLITLLVQKNLTEVEIANSLNIPVLTIRRIVTGETSDPRISTLQLIANYLNVSIDSLLEENESCNFIPKNSPHFVPIIDWEDLSARNSGWHEKARDWEPVITGVSLSLSRQSFSLISKPSMQPRFPLGTRFIIDPKESPRDGDLALIKMLDQNEISLRELVIDPPEWQLLPIVHGSKQLFFDTGNHQIIGVVILTILNVRNKYK